MFLALKRLLLLLLILTSIACTPEDLSTIKNGDTLKLNGTLHMVGNAPFQHLALRTINNQTIKLIFKYKKEESKAIEKIGHRVNIKGIIQIKELKTADNKYTLSEYKLTVNSIRYKGFVSKNKHKH